MLHKKNPRETDSWKKLEAHYEEIKDVEMKDLFAHHPDRFNNFSRSFEDLHLDFSKNRILDKTFTLLIELAKELALGDGIRSMFGGKRINETENRAVLHTALRNTSGESVMLDGHDVMEDVLAEREKMYQFVNAIHEEKHTGYTNKAIKHFVNIGIGGSDLGPVMVTEALKAFWKKGVNVSFVSNVDGTHIAETLKTLDPEETLFIIASKTFTTQETMRNAHTARAWFLDQGADEAAIADHFIALSTNVEGASNFGINEKNIFKFWDWVGGRYSLSSSIGMSIALCIGTDHFQSLLQGMHAMDKHYKETAFEDNLPVILALLGIWYNNFFNFETEAILPYEQYLHRFPAYFQQGNMESNGKMIDRSGTAVTYQTGPIIWGEPGTNGQHAFYQLIHQGTKIIPCDFIASAISQNPIADHHDMLLSNFFAQTEALMNGKTKEEVIAEFEEKGIAKEDYESIVPFKVFPGNRPSNSILLKALNPYTLGQLIVLYEHKIFTQGYLWNIFSFDQWGVELGKQLAKKILPELSSSEMIDSHDSSTNGLINLFKKIRSKS